MSNETIDKKAFAVDLKLVWAAAAFIAWGVYQGTNRLNEMESNIKALQDAPSRIVQIERAQLDADNTIKILKDDVGNIKDGMKTIEGDVAYIRQQITILSTQERNR
jgi:septal ring factor EnvC (AmiA/AmiB activator)